MLTAVQCSADHHASESEWELVDTSCTVSLTSWQNTTPSPSCTSVLSATTVSDLTLSATPPPEPPHPRNNPSPPSTLDVDDLRPVSTAILSTALSLRRRLGEGSRPPK
ncbi:hypothetical protein ACOMHN_060328 [Nucella lapillus]